MAVECDMTRELGDPNKDSSQRQAVIACFDLAFLRTNAKS